MGERLLCKQEVIGSIPFTSTTVATTLRPRDRRCAASEGMTFGEEPEGYRPGMTRGGMLFEG